MFCLIHISQENVKQTKYTYNLLSESNEPKQ